MMKLQQAPTDGSSVNSGDVLLSKHLEVWGGSRQDEKCNGQQGWAQISIDSSQLNNAASPFDDIGYLAGGQGEQISDSQKGSKLGKFLQTSKADSIGAMDDGPVETEAPPRRRLDKTLSHRTDMKDDDVSLALSAVMKHPEKPKGGRGMFDFSKNSLGLSALGASKSASSKNKSKSQSTSKNSFGLSVLGSSHANSSKHTSSKSKNKSFDSSKSSFGASFLGTSRTASTDGSRSFGFSSMMRSKEGSRHSKGEQIANLQTENSELEVENKRLQAELAAMSKQVAEFNALKEWQSIEELATLTSELCQYKTLCVWGEIALLKQQQKLDAQEHLIDSKERSICTLESIREASDKRIGYLEMKCLENGIEIAEEKPMSKRLRESVLAKPDGAESVDLGESISSFAEQMYEDEVVKPPSDKLGNALTALDRPDDKLLTPMDALEEEQSQQVSELSKPEKKQDSWLTLDTKLSGNSDKLKQAAKIDEPEVESASYGESPIEKPPAPFKVRVPSKSADNFRPGVPLEDYLNTSQHKKSAPKAEDCDTNTWTPNSVCERAFGKGAEDKEEAPLPPPAPPTHTQSAPGPSRRKRASAIDSTRKARSKSPGSRRRLKDRHSVPAVGTPSMRGSELEESPASGQRTKSPGRSSRSKSPGIRRRVKESSRSPGPRRRLRANNSTGSDGLPRGSGHSISRLSAHRRRQRKEHEAGRQTVTDAMEFALGSSKEDLFAEADLPLPPPPPPSMRTPKSSPMMSAPQPRQMVAAKEA